MTTGGHFKAPWELLGVRFLAWAAPEYFVYCVRRHSPGNKCSGNYHYYSVANNRWLPAPETLSSDGRWELHWGSRGSLMSNSSHLGELGKFMPHLGQHNRSSCSAMWQRLHKHLSSPSTGLSLSSCKHEFWKGWGVCVYMCIGGGSYHRGIHCTDFLIPFSVPCWISEPPSLLSSIRECNFAGLQFTSLKLFPINFNMLWWLFF